MAIAFTTLIVRHERRIRLLFDQALGGGAFSTGLYVVTCTDGAGENPNVVAAMLVPNAPNAVELALDIDLVAGAIYAVTSASVPGADASLSASAAEPFTFGALTAPTQDVEQSQDDLGALVYGVDLVWTGADFLEDATGDLATVSGVANVQGAIHRRLLDEDGLPWDPTYGAHAADYVNGPTSLGSSLVAALRRQVIADDRVQSASVSFLEDEANPGDGYFPVVVTLKGSQSDAGFTVNVNLPGTS